MPVLSHDDFIKKYGRDPSFTPGQVTQNVQDRQDESIGQKLAGAAQAVTNFVGAKGIADEFGATIARAVAPKDQKNSVEFPTGKEVIGSAIQSGANLIPGAGKGASILAKTAIGAGTGYAFDVGNKLQNDRTVGQSITPGAGTVLGAGLPVAAKAASVPVAIVGRLLKGVGSGLSGVPTKTINQIVDNPKAAIKASNLLSKKGADSVLEDNAKTIVQGIGKVRQEARAAYGNALEGLAKEDINPTTFRQGIQPVLDKFGVSSDKSGRTLSGVEFEEPKNIQKASDLIDKLSTTELDGVSLRKIVNQIEDARYKTATSDERLSFNAFLNDLGAGVKNAINNSTDKLTEMNTAFSKDMQLAQTMEGVFGKVKYNNLPELVRASQKLETLFSKQGLAPREIDNFLTRIGVHPGVFNTTEAVRQIGNKEQGANGVGLSLGELARETTSAIVSPQMVKNLSIVTGLAENAITPFLNGLSKPARNAVIEAVLQSQNQAQ